MDRRTPLIPGLARLRLPVPGVEPGRVDRSLAAEEDEDDDDRHSEDDAEGDPDYAINSP
jgi:hypothetical protein